jgi:hypothetical protein
MADGSLYKGANSFLEDVTLTAGTADSNFTRNVSARIFSRVGSTAVFTMTVQVRQKKDGLVYFKMCSSDLDNCEYNNCAFKLMKDSEKDF